MVPYATEAGTSLILAGQSPIDTLMKTLKLSRERAQQMCNEIRAELENIYDCQSYIAGSLRRGKPEIGDLDIILVTSRALDQPIPVNWKISNAGTCKLSLEIQGIQVDVRACTLQTLGSHLLYFTGPRKHNIKIRSIAKKLGYKLSEYGISDNLATNGKSETIIYHILNLEWIRPEDRHIIVPERNIPKRCHKPCPHCGQPCIRFAGHTHYCATEPPPEKLTGHTF